MDLCAASSLVRQQLSVISEKQLAGRWLDGHGLYILLRQCVRAQNEKLTPKEQLTSLRRDGGELTREILGKADFREATCLSLAESPCFALVST